jgi:hypothetical protein
MDLSTLPVAGNSGQHVPALHPSSRFHRIHQEQVAPPRVVVQNHQKRALAQSGMGVASLVLAIFSLLNIVLLIAVVAATSATYPGRTAEETPFHYLIGIWEFATALIAVGGIVFGIGGLRQPNCRYSFATVGLCLNVAIPIGIMFFLLLSMSTQPQSTPAQEVDDAPAPTSVKEQPAWRSPAALTMQVATIGMAGVLVAYSWRNRTKPNVAPAKAAELVSCEICRKEVPNTSRFCRRCGHAMAAHQRHTLRT